MKATLGLIFLVSCLATLTCAWTGVSTYGYKPSQRSSPSVGVITGTSNFLVFGGTFDNFNTTTTPINDLYLYTATSPFTGYWTQIHGWTTDSRYPSARGFSGYASTSQGLYVYGGSYYTNPYAPTFYGDFWFFNVAANAWTELTTTTNPGVRAASAMVTIGSNLYLFGGITASYQTKNDLWKYNIASNTWTNITTGGSQPTPMENHIAVVSGNTIFVGFGETYTYPSFGVTVGMWSIDVSSANPTWTYIYPASSPSTRNYVAGVSDGQGHVIIFGADLSGGAMTCGAPFDQNPTNQTWVYTSNTGQWAQSNNSCFPTLIDPITFPYGIKRHRGLVAPAPAPFGGTSLFYAFGGYGWNAESPDCATRQEWNGDLVTATIGEILGNTNC
jgi:N-acetylneuraminic acid mutarotase